MIELPKSIRNAVSSISRLPGIGEKTATRMVLQMTRWKSEEIKSIARSIENILDVRTCQECGFFAEEKLCDICSDHSRNNATTICVVENVTDLLAIEKSGHYKGLYYILGGVLNPLLGIGPDQLKLHKLIDKIHHNSFQEVILALNPSVEGDATCAYIRELIPESVKVERIGFGIPIGGSLEYLDSMTISKALENRKTF